MNEESLTQLQTLLGIEFHDLKYLEHALTHRSAASTGAHSSNERLEFLGDSIVGVAVADYLYRHYPERSEGDLAKSKSYIVSEPALAEAAMRLGLDGYVVMSDSEAAAGGRKRRSILADAFEALVAGIYLDLGFETGRKFVWDALLPAITATIDDIHRHDYKSSLQELTQARSRKAPFYSISNEIGKDHAKTFVAQAMLGGDVIGEGSGASKKEAEQAAALNALHKLKQIFPAETENASAES